MCVDGDRVEQPAGELVYIACTGYVHVQSVIIIKNLIHLLQTQQTV